MKYLKRTVLIAVVLYLFAVMVTFSLQKNLIFYPEKLAENFQFDLQGNAEEVFLQTADGETINGLYYPGDKPETILYFHGNAGSLSSWQYVAEDFTSLGYNFLIIDYRGYGKSTGDITEEGLYQDAEAAFKFLKNNKGISPENIIIYGRSIGTGVAVELASRHQAKGLILESAYTSLKKLANQKMPFLLPSLFLKFHFDNIKKIDFLKTPVLLIHGSQDSLIPPSHSKQLFEAFSGKKKLVVIPKGGHNNLNNFPEYQRLIAEAIPNFF